MSKPGDPGIPFIPVPQEWKDDSYLDVRLWDGTDDKRAKEGVRIYADAAFGIAIPGLPIQHKEIPNVGNVHLITWMTTPNPPSATICGYMNLLWDTLTGAVKEHSSQGGTFFPWLSWKDYSILYKYLISVMTLDGDESYWREVIQAQKAPLVKLARIMSAFYSITAAYGSICRRYNENKLIPLSKQQWEFQASFIEIKDLQAYIVNQYQVATTFKIPPSYSIPPLGFFNQTVNALLSIAQNPNVVVHPLLGSYPQEAQYGPVTLLYLYRSAFPELAKQVVETPHNLETVVFKAFGSQWVKLIGAEAFYKRDYNALRAAWGDPTPPRPVELSIHIENLPEPPLCQPPPRKEDADFLLKLASYFSGGYGRIPLDYLPLMQSFLTYTKTSIGFKNPFSFDAIYAKLKDPVYLTVYQDWCNAYVSYVHSYALLFQQRSHNGRLTYEEWIWDKNYLTKHQNESIKDGYDPFTDKYIQDAWPEPWNLKGKELDDYLDAMVGPHHGNYPFFRDKRPLEGVFNDHYDELVAKSKLNYDQWRKAIHDNTSKLKDYPVGLPMKDSSWNGTNVYNWYSDFGVWADTGTEREKALKAFWSPWLYLTGSTLLQTILDTALAVFKVVLDTLEKVANEIPWDKVWKLGLPLLLIGGAAIVGVHEAERILDRK